MERERERERQRERQRQREREREREGRRGEKRRVNPKKNSGGDSNSLDSLTYLARPLIIPPDPAPPTGQCGRRWKPVASESGGQFWRWRYVADQPGQRPRWRHDQSVKPVVFVQFGQHQPEQPSLHLRWRRRSWGRDSARKPGHRGGAPSAGLHG